MGARRGRHPLRRRERRADHQPQPRRPDARAAFLVDAVKAAAARERAGGLRGGQREQQHRPPPGLPGFARGAQRDRRRGDGPVRTGRSIGDFSNYGKLTVPLAAPGASVLSTSNDGGYEPRSGTSMAAPHAAGVAALMAAVRPDATAAELRAMMLQAASASSLPVGAGYLDAARSVLQAINGVELQAADRRRSCGSCWRRGASAGRSSRWRVVGARDAIARYKVQPRRALGRRQLKRGIAVHGPHRLGAAAPA